MYKFIGRHGLTVKYLQAYYDYEWSVDDYNYIEMADSDFRRHPSFDLESVMGIEVYQPFVITRMLR